MKNHRPNGIKNGLSKESDPPVNHVVKWLLAVIFIVSLGVLYRPQTFEGEAYNYSAGEICREEIRAPNAITLYKDAETWSSENKAARQRAPFYLVFKSGVGESHIKYLDTFFSYVDSLAMEWKSYPDSVEKTVDFSPWNFGVSDASLEIFFESDKRRSKLESYIRRTVEEFYSRGILEDNEDLKKKGNREIVLVKNEEELPARLSDFYSSSTYLNKLVRKVEAELGDDNEDIRVSGHIIARVLTPNVLVDNDRIREAADREEAKLTRELVTFLADEKIIGRYEKVTDEHAKILKALVEELTRNPASKAEPGGFFLEFFSKIAFLCSSLVLFSWYISRFRPKIFSDNSRLILLLILALLPAYASAYILYSPSFNEYLIPVTAASILCVILIDAQLAVVFSVFISLICTSFAAFDVSLFIVSLISSVTASLCFKASGSRLTFIKMGVYISAAYIFSVTFTGIIDGVYWVLILKRAGYGAVSAFASTFFAVSVLPLFEKGFKITTEFTLNELSDLNRPILRRMSLEAPGTYHHSIVVGNLAEAGALAIGADSLLARVGSYYHDLGKLLRPEYFIENQLGRVNKHDVLSPAMSNLVILSHVKEGVELGRKEGLPEVIVNFIREHHGNSVQRYFYNKARETDTHNVVRAEDYRYPGPKPMTRETAIVMLADTVEAMANTLKDTSQGKIKGLIKKAFDTKINDHQLSECDLTFNDMAKIRESFIPILNGILQKRIDYPSQPGEMKVKATEKERKEDADSDGTFDTAADRWRKAGRA